MTGRASILARAATFGAALAICAGLFACGDAKNTGGDALVDATADADDVRDLTGRSIYTLHVTLPNGTVRDYVNRELTGLETWYSYGSAGIGTAVAFAVTDSIFSPGTATVTFDFGKIVGSPTFPVETPGIGAYPLDETPPAIEFATAFEVYKSRGAGSDGEIVLTDWGTKTGEVIAGTVNGTIAATASGQLPITVEGWFHFTLPGAGGSSR
jgi:hypothetical protein